MENMQANYQNVTGRILNYLSPCARYAIVLLGSEKRTLQPFNQSSEGLQIRFRAIFFQVFDLRYLFYRECRLSNQEPLGATQTLHQAACTNESSHRSRSIEKTQTFFVASKTFLYSLYGL